MSDTTTATTEETSATTAKTNSDNAGTETDTSSATTSEGAENPTDAQGSTDNQAKFTQADVDRIIRERLAKAEQAAKKKADDAAAAAEAERLKAQGEYQKLYEAEKARAEAAEQAHLQAERERIIDRIAAEHGLPDALRNRLKGETEDELKADAAEVAKYLAPTNGNGRREAPLTESQRHGQNDALMSADEMQAVATKMGLKVPAGM